MHPGVDPVVGIIVRETKKKNENIRKLSIDLEEFARREQQMQSRNLFWLPKSQKGEEFNAIMLDQELFNKLVLLCLKKIKKKFQKSQAMRF